MAPDQPTGLAVVCVDDHADNAIVVVSGRRRGPGAGAGAAFVAALALALAEGWSRRYDVSLLPLRGSGVEVCWGATGHAPSRPGGPAPI